MSPNKIHTEDGMHDSHLARNIEIYILMASAADTTQIQTKTKTKEGQKEKKKSFKSAFLRFTTMDTIPLKCLYCTY